MKKTLLFIFAITTFSLSAQPPGDDCFDAVPIEALFGQATGIPQASELFDNTDAFPADTDPNFGFECFGEPDGSGSDPTLDATLWFTFTGDGNNYRIRTAACNSTNYLDFGDTQIAGYTGSCNDLTPIVCNEDAPGATNEDLYAEVEIATQAGETYYLLIDGFNFNGALSFGEFCIEVTNLSSTTPPDGDVCTDANDISSLFGQAVNAPQTSALYNNTSATTQASDPEVGFGCFGEPDGSGDDPSLDKTLWFTFPGDGARYVVRTSSCTATDYINDGDTQLALYSGNCQGLVPVSCNEDAADASTGNLYAEITFTTSPGTEYYLLVDGFNFNGFISDGEYCLEVTRVKTAGTVAGDLCTDANDLNALFGQPINQAQTSPIFDNTNATTGSSDPTFGFTCFGEPDGQGGNPSLEKTLWYTFTGDGDGYVIRTVNCNATNYIDDGDTQIAVYRGECNGLIPVDCNEDAPMSTQGNLFAEVAFLTEPGVTYYMLVDGFNFNGTISDGEYCIEVTRSTATPTTEWAENQRRPFPNPTKGLVQLGTTNYQLVEVYDISGRLLATDQRPTGSVDLSPFKSGVYLIKSYTKNDIHLARIIRE